MKQQEQAAGGTPEFVHDEAGSRYVLRRDGEVAAFAQYDRQGNAVRFTHTEVDARYEGQGLGSRLAAFALDDVKTRGLKAIPSCRFIASYVARHEKEYGDLVAS
jgi:predicted GNAT family acetyltransferase